jgi:predicted O-methyltransferase YrrM
MTLDITYGNVTQEQADRLGQASVMPVDASISDKAVAYHQSGDTEPWVSRLVGDLVVATGARTVLETGTFTGATSAYLYDALQRLGRGELYLCELDEVRADATKTRLRLEQQDDLVVVHSLIGDVLPILAACPRMFDLAFVDDDHTKVHVHRELMALIPKMNKGGVILLHDVWGSCDLQSVVRSFGGYSLNLPRLGPAGGLGIIQV